MKARFFMTGYRKNGIHRIFMIESQLKPYTS